MVSLGCAKQDSGETWRKSDNFIGKFKIVLQITRFKSTFRD